MSLKYIKNPKNLNSYVLWFKVKQTDTVLDIWCGIKPQNIIKPITHICCEPYKEYVDFLLNKMKKYSNLVVMNINRQETVDILTEKSVDTIVLLDVIEHLEKQEWYELLKKTVLLARKQVIIFTPYWFLPQEVPAGMKDAWWLDWAEWQRHKSWWTEEDFSKERDVYICPEYHFEDAITWKRFEKPYWAMYAILNKKFKTKKNIYSIVRFFIWFTRKIYYIFRIDRFIYSNVWFYIYRHNKFASAIYNKYFK